MLKQLPMEDARDALLQHIKPLERELLPSLEAVGRILAEDILAPHNLPPYRQAAMDGFALSQKGEKGERFSVKKYLMAGDVPAFTLQPGEAAGVVTGGHIPPGTAAVVCQENAHEQEGSIFLTSSVPGDNNIRNKGEDFKTGTLIARRGTRITPGLIAILTAYGIREAAVLRRPKVAIISLGKEIVPYDQDPVPGDVRDSNGPLLASLVKLQGGSAAVSVSQFSSGEELNTWLQQADLVITIGGTAAGSNDRAKRLLEETDAQPLFLSYQVKPGSHTCAGVRDGKLIIMLSGNPMACFVGYFLLAYPVLRAFQGLNPEPQRFSAVATSPFPKKGGPRRFLLGYALYSDNSWRVAVLPAQKSSMRRSLGDCNCLIDLPAGHPPVEPGAEVLILPILDTP